MSTCFSIKIWESTSFLPVFHDHRPSIKMKSKTKDRLFLGIIAAIVIHFLVNYLAGLIRKESTYFLPSYLQGTWADYEIDLQINERRIRASIPWAGAISCDVAYVSEFYRGIFFSNLFGEKWYQVGCNGEGREHLLGRNKLIPYGTYFIGFNFRLDGPDYLEIDEIYLDVQAGERNIRAERIPGALLRR